MKSGRILVVDDDVVNVDLIRDILDDQFLVESAFSGQEGLDLAYKFKPDIILLDIMMPDLDGYEVCKKIRESKDLRFTKTFLVSAKIQKEDRLQGYDCGADEYISKPFYEKELLAKIKVFLNLKYEQEFDEMKMDLFKLLHHEAKTPLNAILGFSRLIQQQANADVNCSLCSSRIHYVIQNSERLMRLIETINLLAELKEGRCVKLGEGFISSSIQTAISRIDHEKGLQNIFQLQFVRPHAEKIMMLDTDLLSEAIYYVMSGMFQYAQGGAKICINLKYEQEYCFVLFDVDKVFCAQEDMARVFEEFSSNDIRHHSGRFNMGLAIARYIVKQHRGDMIMQKNDGNRVQFVLNFKIK